jgi:hypothetical protein
MAEVDKDLIRAQMAELLERAGEPQVFDEGLGFTLATCPASAHPSRFPPSGGPAPRRL